MQSFQLPEYWSYAPTCTQSSYAKLEDFLVMAIKEISVQPVADHWANQGET